MQLQSTSGLTQVRYEVADYPVGFTAPAGWSTDSSGVIFYAPSNVTVPPPSFNIGASGSNNWGMFMLRVRGNSGAGLNPLRLNADGSPNVSYSPLLTDEGSIIEVLSPNLHMQGIGFGLATQIDTLRQSVGSLMQSFRVLDAIAAGVLAITGTGLVHVTANTVDGTAYKGTANQLIAMNAGGTDQTWFTAGGDLTYAAGSFTVTGLQGRPMLSAAPTLNQAVVWNGTQWAPATQAGALSVTGSGVWHSISGTLQAAALIGSADQLFGTNHAATDTVFFTLAGDASLASGSLTVTGIQTKPVPAPTGTATVLTWNAGSSGLFSWAAAGGSGAISAFGQDLVNSTATLQYVSGLSFNATAAGGGAGGVIPVWGTGTFLNWKNEAITLQQAGTSLVSLKASTANDFIAFGATPGSLGFLRATVNATILGLNGVGILYSDASNNAYYGFQAAATGLGASSFFQAQNAGGAGNTGGTAFVVSGAGTTSGPTGPIALCLGSTSPTNQINFLGGAFSGNPGNLGTMQWATGMTAILTQASTSGATGADFTINPQQSTAATNWSNGNVVVVHNIPGGTGVESYLKGKRSSNYIYQLGLLSGQSYGALYLGSNVSPAANNHAIASDGTSTYVNATSGSVQVSVNAIGVAQFTATQMQFGRLVSAPGIGQIGLLTDVPVQALTIFAQSCWTGASTNINGARLQLWGGDAKSDGVTGRRGGVQATLGNGSSALFEIAELVINQRIVALCKGSDVSTSDMPTSSGDLVVFIGNRNTAPTANPSNGFIAYGESGAGKSRGASGTTTTFAPA